METIAGLDNIALILVIAVAIGAGVIKGMVGFALPTVLMSGLTLIVAPEQALAALILPTLITNGWQALRQGLRAALVTVGEFRLFLLFGAVTLVLSAQLVPRLDARALYGMIGGPITVFAVIQLAGWRPMLAARSAKTEAAVGSFAGFIGGLSGIWGPPTVAYLTAIDTPKQEHLRAQGVIYGLGAAALAGAHLQSGVLRAETLPLTLLILPCALLGLWLGFKLQDRISQEAFRRATLIVLVFAGLNLLRRAAFG